MSDIFSDPDVLEASLTIHRDLPRQGPGSDATTRALFALAGPLPPSPRVLDLGCGPGRAALLLAEEAGAEVTAVDLYEPFLIQLRQEAERRGLADRIHAAPLDFASLPYPAGSFDLVWAEGSVYNLGFATGLRIWRRLLAPGGTLMVSECEWLVPEPSAPARAYWDALYPLSSPAANIDTAVHAGYTVIASRTQPDSDWFEEYYTPLLERMAGLDPDLPGMRAAMDLQHREIDLRRSYGTEYGYTGYVLRPQAESAKPAGPR
ncbi:class I SAM-dependent methyltransferase [Streptomyces oceani]|uniref:Methyltransferase type 11 n=1 Tax=Streptomyces oceani TaxID=1075402 RepID=A0A1E7JW60_9ACTN|nr:class I SAM-dependent methyltransferase [Streptomyces oceani]OEU95486.1 methyltransferase type 11 [Streptomyces oceani]